MSFNGERDVIYVCAHIYTQRVLLLLLLSSDNSEHISLKFNVQNKKKHFHRFLDGRVTLGRARTISALW